MQHIFVCKPDSEVLFTEEKCTATNRGIGGELYIKKKFPSF